MSQLDTTLPIPSATIAGYKLVDTGRLEKRNHFTYHYNFKITEYDKRKERRYYRI